MWHSTTCSYIYIFCIVGKFGKSSMISQTKTIQINTLLADLLVCQTFIHQMPEKSQFAELSATQYIASKPVF